MAEILGLRTEQISIHTLLAGSDYARKKLMTVCHEFQSTLPLRGATLANGIVVNNFIFQSTLPLRGATWALKCSFSSVLFQSTLPLRGATNPSPIMECGRHISIHTPLAGSDPAPYGRGTAPQNFNPHSPCGERPENASIPHVSPNFNPHSPCGERPMIIAPFLR